MDKLIKDYCKNIEFVNFNRLPEIFGKKLSDIVMVLGYTQEFMENGIAYFIIDDKGNRIYRYERGTEMWVKYDSKRNVIHNRDNSGNWENYEYNERGQTTVIENENYRTDFIYNRNGELENQIKSVKK